MWFESIAEAERRAERNLPRSVFKAIMAGAERGQTLHDNVAAFAELGFAPHVAGAPGVRDLSTTVMGVGIDLPVVLSPTGVQAVHPEGEVAVARAAAARGTALGLERAGEHADRGRHRRESEDVRAALLGGLAGVDRGAGAARSRRRAPPA